MTISITFYERVHHMAISNFLENSKAMTIIFYGKVSYMALSNVYKNKMKYQSNTTKLYYIYYCTRATCFDSYRIIFRPF